MATAAVRALSEWAFTHTWLERLEIVAATGNLRSRRVAEKAGAVREEVARSRLRLHERFHDAVVYSIVRGQQRTTLSDSEGVAVANRAAEASTGDP